MKPILDFFMSFGLSEYESATLLKMLLSSICGGLIGLERGMKGRPAGPKTFSLVCLGATLIMITGNYINITFSSGGSDPTRMAAQVISGIGFLGAGSIIVTGHNQVKGLTTAAALWVTAALGIAIGSGFYFGGIAGFCVIYITSFIYQCLDDKILETSRAMKIYVEGKDEDFMLRLINCLTAQQAKIVSLQRKSDSKWYAEDACAIIELDFGKRDSHKMVLEKIRELEGLRYIEEI